jgi:PAS domain S-box-containing protein
MQEFPQTPEELQAEIARLRAERDRLRQELLTAHLRTTVDALPQMGWTSDCDGRFDYGNDHWVRYSGVRLEETGPSGWVRVVHEADWPLHKGAWSTSIATGEPFEATLRLLGTDGVHRWHICRAVPVRDRATEITGWIGICTDIDEYNKAKTHLLLANHALESQRLVLEQLTSQLRTRGDVAEEALRQRNKELEAATQDLMRSEGMLSEAQRIAHLGNWEWDIPSNRIVWSEELFRIMGVTRATADPSLETFVSAFHPEDRERFRDRLVRAIQSHEPFSYEGRVRHPDGAIRIIDGQAKLILDEKGRPHRMVGTAQDITERKEAERTLQESEERFRRFFTASFEGLVITEGSLILDLNEACAHMFGYDPTELVGQSIFDLLAPESREAFRERDRSEFEGAFEAIGIRRNGHAFPVEVHSKTIPMKGDLVRVSAVRDISERRAIERMKEEFVSMVSHELRTPLTSLRGSLGLVANGLLGPIPEKAQDLLAVAMRSTERLVRLINDILDIDRLQSGQVRMELKECDARALAVQAIEAMGSMAESAGVTIVSDLEPLPLLADPDRLTQVLINLLSNAIKFSSTGTTITMRLHREGESVVFRVEDQGRGIPADKLETIFERFMQVDASDSRAKGGTGLGLAISRSIVEHHGGRIWAESEPGQGSTFIVRLPLPPAERTPTSRDAAAAR